MEQFDKTDRGAGNLTKNRSNDYSYKNIVSEPANNDLCEVNESSCEKLEKRTPGKGYPQCSVINILKTVATYVAFFGRGMATSIIGATILQLQQQTKSTSKEVASIFSWTALGSMVGNLLTGLVFEWVPPEIFLGSSCLVMAAAMLAVPFCTSFWSLMGVLVVNGLTQGILGGGCNSYIMQNWQLKAAPFLQALHFIISLGSSISPLIVDGFVSDQMNESEETNSKAYNNISDDMSESNAGVTAYFYNSSTVENGRYHLDFITSTNSSLISTYRGLNLLYPYLVTAICLVVACVGYAGALVTDIVLFQRDNFKRTRKFFRQKKVQQSPTTSKGVIAVLLIYLMIYGGLEYSYGSWIVAFCVKYAGVSFETATLIASAFWFSLAVGRAISIVTVKVFSVVSLTCVCLLAAFTALLIETVACKLHPGVIWASTIVVGLSLAPLFGNCVSYSQEELHITSRTITLFVFFLYLGFMGMPALVGLLFAKYTPMFFLYILLGGSLVITLLFYGVAIYMKRR